MYSSLSEQQLRIRDYGPGRVVVKACPGSGKTYSVAARVAYILSREKFYGNGIASLSFTNVACEEIAEKLRTSFGIPALRHPHFLGTIDKFLNTFLFLPYGHLIMGCPHRPELVGEPHRPWTKGKGDKRYTFSNGKRRCVQANPDGYFDCTSFDINGMLIPIVPAQEIHFSLKPENYYNQDGSITKRVRDVIDAKNANFNLGFANQTDANYISLKILEQYPRIRANLARRFKYFIIDEAQDTDAIQMRIVELLHGAGAANIMLIGDRDQSIFEFKSAEPALFDAKYAAWDKITLNENRRSSQNICRFTAPFSSFERSFAVNPEVRYYDHHPEILTYPLPKKVNGNWVVSETQSKQAVLSRISYFCAACEQNGINITDTNVAVLFRGWKQAEALDIKKDIFDYEKNPWAKHCYHVKDLLKGFILYSKGLVKEGYQLIEKAYFEALHKPGNANFHCTQKFIEAHIKEGGLRSLRDKVAFFIRQLLAITGKTIRQWVTLCNQRLQAAQIPITLQVNTANASILIEDYFAGELNPIKKHPFYCGTIHSVKGRTFDAVLLLVSKKTGSTNYATILQQEGPPSDKEELRNIYVAITRPRKLLMLAVPHEDAPPWRQALP